MDGISFSAKACQQLCIWLDTHQPQWGIGSIHGAISAAVACDQDYDLTRLVAEGLLPDLRSVKQLVSNDGEEADPAALFDLLLSSTTYQLTSTEFDYQLQLSDDDTPISTRVRELAAWCDAFTLCYSIIASKQAVSKDTIFFMNVMASVQSVDPAQDEQLPNDEEFETISESIRMGVINLHSEQHTQALDGKNNLKSDG